MLFLSGWLRGLLTGFVVVAGAVGLGWCGSAWAQEGGSAVAGSVKFVKRTAPAFNHFMEDPAFQSWISQNFWRAEVVSPYFDDKTSWYPHGLVYRDLYALYTGAGYTSEHESWILRDGAGERLYIPWGCTNGTCPQYAADVGNPEFRHAWITEAKAEVEKGYAGLWIDDVNLEFQVGNGAGEHVAPIDPRTGETMTEHAWQEYVVTFLEEIRNALPGVEILENSIWYAGGPERWKNPLVKRQIASANDINLERGVNDEGLTGGNGAWSLKTFLSFIDDIHAASRNVILDGFDNSPTGREYSLACYFLISTGNDGLGNAAMTPENWWPAYNIELGAPEGPRTEWQGLLRRNFADGITLVNEPDAPTRTVTLPAPMYTTAGAIVNSVTLGAANGAILRYEPASPPTGPTEPPPGPPPPNASTGTPVGSTPTDGATGTPREPTEAAPGAQGRAPTDPVQVILKARSTHRGRAIILHGRVLSANTGRVQIRLQRRGRGRWIKTGELTASVRTAGRFATTLRYLPHGHYRVQATYLPAPKLHTANSPPVAFAVAT